MSNKTIFNDFVDHIRSALDGQRLSARSAAAHSGLPVRSIQAVLEGHEPSISRANEICCALRIRLYLGDRSHFFDIEKPAKIGANEGGETDFSAEKLEILSALGLPVDAELEQILSAIADLSAPKSDDDWRNSMLRELKTMRTTIEKTAHPVPIAWKSISPERAQEIRSQLYGEPVVPLHADLSDDNALSAEAAVAARPVATLEYDAAAGGGAVNLDEAPIKGEAWFRRSWLDRRGLDPTQCAVISVRGESMEPTLPDGCSILVARHRQRRLSGHVVVAMTADGLVVKRLGKTPEGGWMLESDHPAWKSIPWQSDTELIGEVVWMAMSL